MSRLTIAQISDSHILADPRGRLRGLEPLPRLERVVARVVQRIADRNDVDLVVFTGDQIQDDPAAYPVFLEAIAPIRIPVAFVPGNHDHREGFALHLLPRQEETTRPPATSSSETDPGHRGGPDPSQGPPPGVAAAGAAPAVARPTAGARLRPRTRLGARLGARPSGPASAPFSPPLYRALQLGPVRILLLDSLQDGEVHGRLGAPQLSWIEETLRAMVPGPTLVFVHHPPIPTGIDWLDPHVIEEGDELVRILVAREVGHLFFGHVHQPMTLERHGLVAVGSAATCFGFGGDGDAPMLLDGPPGLTWIDVVGDQVRSRVEYLPIS